MTAKKTRKQVLAWAAAYDKKLRADDPRLTGVVAITHLDGSSFVLNYAFIVVAFDGWWVAFTAHNGVFVWYRDDIGSYHCYGERRYPERLPARKK